MGTVSSIIKKIRDANLKGEKQLNIEQDKCLSWANMNFDLGNGIKLSYIQIVCSMDMSGEIPFEAGHSKEYPWSIVSNVTKVKIDPSEISKIHITGTKDKRKYVKYQFHALSEPRNANEIPVLTDNMLFQFVVLEEEAKIFEYYLFASKEVALEINKLSVSEDLIKRLTKDEGKVDHVYNDAKGAKSYYCDEHKGHPAISESSHYCDHKDHRNSKGKLGNPTIGIGHLIYGENELQEWCNKSPITEEEIMNLFKKDVKEKAENQLKYYINKNIGKVELNQCQYDALVSIVFNRGMCNFMKSSVWIKYFSEGVFNTDDPDKNEKIKDALINDGSTLAGSNRRKGEAELYFNCTY